MNKLAEFPLERSGLGDAPDDTVIVAWPAWSLTVGDVRRAMEKTTGDDLSKPLAYVIYGINTLGQYYVHEVKPIQVADTTDEWKSDDDCLGEYWAGNKPLTLAHTTVAPQEDTTPQHSVTEHTAPVKTWQERAGKAPDCNPKQYAYGWYWEHAIAEIADWRAIFAQPLASTAAQPEQSNIKTWQERRNEDRAVLRDAGSNTNGLPLTRYMEAEIADLRAALAIPASTAASEQPDEDSAHIAALSKAATRPYEPVYQIWEQDFPSTWRDVDKAEFDAHPYHKRVVQVPVASEQQAGAADLPPLPEPWITNTSAKDPAAREHYARDQMQDYARAALTHRATQENK